MTLSGELSKLYTHCYTHYKHFRTPSRLLDLTMQADGGRAYEGLFKVMLKTLF
jgi:hypothetical protein